MKMYGRGGEVVRDEWEGCGGCERCMVGWGGRDM